MVTLCIGSFYYFTEEKSSRYIGWTAIVLVVSCVLVNILFIVPADLKKACKKCKRRKQQETKEFDDLNQGRVGWKPTRVNHGSNNISISYLVPSTMNSQSIAEEESKSP